MIWVTTFKTHTATQNLILQLPSRPAFRCEYAQACFAVHPVQIIKKAPQECNQTSF